MTPPSTPFFDVRGRGFRNRADVAAVLDLLDRRVIPLESEVASTSLAFARVLAESVVSPVDVPHFRRAAMDGFAVRAVDTLGTSEAQPLVLEIAGESRPALPYLGILGPGQAVQIATGSRVPAGADAIVILEAANLEAKGRVAIREPVAAGRHVARVGEDVERGREVLAAGRRLRPQDLGLLASIGVASVAVVRRPRVAPIATGRELLPPGSIAEGDRIVDANSPMLAASVIRDGGICLPTRYPSDDRAGLLETLNEAMQVADLVLVTGGSSVGAEDYAPMVVAELGELAIHGIALRPAGPTGIGFLRQGGIPIVLLPGNPISCLCAYDLFAGRILRRLGGRSWELPYRKVSLPLGEAIVSALGRVDYVRVRAVEGRVFALAAGGASNLSSAVAADGFILAQAERDRLEVGEVVDLWLYDG